MNDSVLRIVFGFFWSNVSSFSFFPHFMDTCFFQAHSILRDHLTFQIRHLDHLLAHPRADDGDVCLEAHRLFTNVKPEWGFSSSGTFQMGNI